MILIYLKPAFSTQNPTQLKVEADGSIEYFEKQKIYVATGNATASKGNFSICLTGSIASGTSTFCFGRITRMVRRKTPIDNAKHNAV